jgi:hypothetical protein
MFGAFRTKLARIGITALYVLAMVFVGLAHRPAAHASASIDLAAYTLPDGTVPDLCLNGAGDIPGSGNSVTPGLCDACRLSVAPGLGAIEQCQINFEFTIVGRIGFSQDFGSFVENTPANFWSRAPPQRS